MCASIKKIEEKLGFFIFSILICTSFRNKSKKKALLYLCLNEFKKYLIYLKEFFILKNLKKIKKNVKIFKNKIDLLELLLTKYERHSCIVLLVKEPSLLVFVHGSGIKNFGFFKLFHKFIGKIAPTEKPFFSIFSCICSTLISATSPSLKILCSVAVFPVYTDTHCIHGSRRSYFCSEEFFTSPFSNKY